jgi:hypothetical protein
VTNNTATAAGQPVWDTSWAKVRAAINSGGSGSDAANSKNYVIKVVSNFQLAGDSSFTSDNIKVLIHTPTDKTISSSELSVGSNQTLILRHIILQESVSDSGDAHLLMRPGAVVSSVSVDGGTFLMSGGTVSGRKAYGDDMSVSVSGGTFTMSGGTISNYTRNAARAPHAGPSTGSSIRRPPSGGRALMQGPALCAPLPPPTPRGSGGRPGLLR